MSAQTALRTSNAERFGTDSVACIIPQVVAPVEEQISQLQEKISQLTFDLNLLRRRDEHVNGMMMRLDEEQRLAARLQQDFLPKRLPQLGPVSFQTLYRPAGYVSGDLYDVMRLDEHHVGFYVADAVGHGMPAALLTMFMKNALVTKDIASGGYRILEPHETMARLNNSLCEQNLSNATFATAVYGTLNTKTLTMTVARGGHPSPVLVRDRQLIELQADGALLGIFPGESFASCSVQLRPGDRVLIYTDGIEMAMTNGEVADDELWRAEVLRLSDHPLSEMLGAFSAQLDSNTGSLLPRDDLTMVAFDVR